MIFRNNPLAIVCNCQQIYTILTIFLQLALSHASATGPKPFGTPLANCDNGDNCWGIEGLQFASAFECLRKHDPEMSLDYCQLRPLYLKSFFSFQICLWLAMLAVPCAESLWKSLLEFLVFRFCVSFRYGYVNRGCDMFVQSNCEISVDVDFRSVHLHSWPLFSAYSFSLKSFTFYVPRANPLALAYGSASWNL